MKLAINLLLSFAMLALCLWLVWPNAADRVQLETALRSLEWASFAPYLGIYVGLMVISQLCRSLRWNYLLAPLGISIPAGPMLAISSVGFMAIIALPARLGELVRPGLLRRRGISASAALGTVAVERIIDGLMISLFVFGAFFAIRGPEAPPWMMPTAYAALGGFVAALVFLVFAMRRPDATVRFCLRLSLLPRLAPRIARVIEGKLHDMIRGFAVLRDGARLAKFCAWTLVYWTANGFAVWVLAEAFHLELSLVGAFAVMGLVGVGISLPNSPGMVGQFQWFTLLGLSLYLGPAVLERTSLWASVAQALGAPVTHGSLYGTALAYSIVQHVLQVGWYVVMGALALATPWVSFQDLRHVRDATPTPPPPVAP
ncbi:MAG: hypothetical protein H6Q90_4038 [Deltaproteobacteria bacterium]|nr:hypothetical protein [Deltaproteobacteria bacterium]